MKRVPFCVVSCLFLVLIVSGTAIAQTTTITYHLHKETNNGCPRALLTGNPEPTSTFTQSANLQNTTASPVTFEHFCAPAIPGTIPGGSTVNLYIWMQKTANFGVIYPYFKLWLEGDPSVGNRLLCSGTGATALPMTTLSKMTVPCTIGSETAIGSQYFGLDVGYSIGTVVGNHAEYIKAYYEGTFNGNYDSTLVVPRPLSITSLSPTSGPAGTPVTIGGTRFGATQGTSTVKFSNGGSGITGTPTSWSDTSIVVPVPCGAATGPVTVTANATSNGITFTAGACISGLSPTSGAAGTSVTISGQKFGTS